MKTMDILLAPTEKEVKNKTHLIPLVHLVGMDFHISGREFQCKKKGHKPFRVEGGSEEVETKKKKNIWSSFSPWGEEGENKILQSKCKMFSFLKASNGFYKLNKVFWDPPPFLSGAGTAVGVCVCVCEGGGAARACIGSSTCVCGERFPDVCCCCCCCARSCCCELALAESVE